MMIKPRAKKDRKPTVLTEFPPMVVEALRSALLKNGYEMMECLGYGSYSMIYRVFSSRHGREFAAKITNTESSRHRTARISAIREEEALQRLSHPNIIKLYGTLQFKDFRILILELCSSSSLRGLIQESQPRPVPRLLSMIGQICSAVYYMHSHRLAHRDIKPANILIGERDRPVIADFGMAQFYNEDELATDFIGSPQYCAPEILRQTRYDPIKADIWALGITFYEMAMGSLPHVSDRQLFTQTMIKGGLLLAIETPPLIRRIVGAMTDLNPMKRPNIESVLNLTEIQKALTMEKNEARVGTSNLEAVGRRTLRKKEPNIQLVRRSQQYTASTISLIRKRENAGHQLSFLGQGTDTDDSLP